MLILVGIIMILVTSICVKLFDSTIRKSMLKKRVVIMGMFTGLVLVVLGIINSFMKFF